MAVKIRHVVDSYDDWPYPPEPDCVKEWNQIVDRNTEHTINGTAWIVDKKGKKRRLSTMSFMDKFLKVLEANNICFCGVTSQTITNATTATKTITVKGK